MTLSFESVCSYLQSLPPTKQIEVREIGRSAGDRPLFLVHLNRGGAKAQFKVLLYAQQHGNEVSGKDALMLLIRDIAEHPEHLPEDVDLYVVPVFNPDGAVTNQRSNGAKADLNRDHLLLTQPETQAFYRAARQIQPHVAVDCHEFTRDNEDFRKAGLERWPLITLDGMNHPLIPRTLRDLALAKVESAIPVLNSAGFPFAPYRVGGPPPEEETRPSTLEPDDGRNGLGTLGAVSFIIEAAIRRSAPDPQADLSLRVAAYLKLFDHLLGTPSSRAQIRTAVELVRREPLPAFIPTNMFWGNVQGKIATLKVIDLAKGQVVALSTANEMSDLVVKASVPTPKAYVIDGRVARTFRPLLEHHGLIFRELANAETIKAERCRLVRLEASYDELYQRYENRQIVARVPAHEEEFSAGSLVVSLDQPLARRAIQVLEPCLLYGLYSHPEFRALTLSDGTLPVHRLP